MVAKSTDSDKTIEGEYNTVRNGPRSYLIRKQIVCSLDVCWVASSKTLGSVPILRHLYYLGYYNLFWYRDGFKYSPL